MSNTVDFYDAAMVLWRTVTNIFFREIRPRGTFNIPREGPVIFVAGPHHNQVCVCPQVAEVNDTLLKECPYLVS